MMLIASAKANQIAGIGKAQDLAPTVRHDLVEADCAGLDTVEVEPGIALCEGVLLGRNGTDRRE
jgi:hypothetical protein